MTYPYEGKILQQGRQAAIIKQTNHAKKNSWKDKDNLNV